MCLYFVDKLNVLRFQSLSLLSSSEVYSLGTIIQAKGVAPIIQLRTCVVKIGHSKVEYGTMLFHKRGLLLKEIIRPLSFKRSPIIKRDAIDKNHCSSKKYPLDVRNYFSVLAAP